MSQKTRVETALTLLTEDGILKGDQAIPIERFEEIFELKRDSQEFHWLVSSLRRALFERGLYLSGDGVSISGCYQLLHPRDNFWVAKLAMVRAERDLTGKQTLLLNTDLKGLSNLEVARHEATLRLLSLRLSALRKVQEHNRTISRQRKELLESDPDNETT